MNVSMLMSKPVISAMANINHREPPHRLVVCLECEFTAPYTAQTIHLRSFSPSTHIHSPIHICVVVGVAGGDILIGWDWEVH